MTTLDPVTACCATLYSHPLAAFLLGRSFHPGGLALTDELAALAGIGPSDVVLDAGSGRGTTSVHLAETVGCNVTGLTIEQDGAAAGEELARARGVSDKVRFVQGDIMELSPSFGCYDVVFMECVLSTLPSKGAALRRLRGLLRDGGVLAISDVTLHGDLPEELRGAVASALCLDGALPFQGYVEVLEAIGFRVTAAREAPQVADSFLAKARRGLMVADAAVGLGKLDMDRGLLESAKRALESAARMANDRSLGYALLIAEKART